MAPFGVMITAALFCPGFATQSCGSSSCIGESGHSFSDETSLLQVNHAANLGKDATGTSRAVDQPTPRARRSVAIKVNIPGRRAAPAKTSNKEQAEIEFDPLGWLGRGIKFLDQHLDTDGLWRIPGSNRAVAALIKRDPDLFNIPPNTPEDVTSVIVKQLAKKTALISEDAFAALRGVGTPRPAFTPDQKADIKKAVDLVPGEPFQELKALFHHWHLVVAHVSVNQMTADALTTCVRDMLISAADKQVYGPYKMGVSKTGKVMALGMKTGEEKEAADASSDQYTDVLKALIYEPDQFFGV